MSTFETIYIIGHTIGSFLLLMFSFLSLKTTLYHLPRKYITLL